MQCIELRGLHTLSRLKVVAPALEGLFVESCFRKSQPVAHISAPLVSCLEWNGVYDPSSVHLEKMARLKWLQPRCYFVYGDVARLLYNRSCLSLLQSIEGTRILFLTLVYPRVMENYDYMMEDMVVLPNITHLRLMVVASGHAFGASAFHVLRLCTSISGLTLDFLSAKVEDACLSDCICLQLVEWKTEELLLNQLEEIEIGGWSGTEHEVAFVKRLFDWGPKLKEMTVTFHHLISKVNAKDLYQTFQSFSRPGVCMEFYLCENNLKVLYAPKD